MTVRAAGAAVPDQDDDGARSTVGRLVAAVRRYWWVVLAVTWLALIGAGVSTARTPTTYAGRTSLIVASNDRAPDQDAVLVQGYVTYFDDDSYQEQLLAEAKVGSGATVAAQSAAASPILVITVTTTDATHAQADAVAVARVFRDDINAVHARVTEAELTTLNDQLDSAVARGSKADQAVIAGLQDRIQQLKDDQVNVLQDLQVNGGVAVRTPSWSTNLLLGLVGGLFVGVLAALVLAKLSPRLRSAEEVADKLGLSTLSQLPRPGSPDTALLGEQQLRKLANVVRSRLGGPGVVAVTQVGEGSVAWLVARELALDWAAQGLPTVLVRLGSGEAAGWRSGRPAPGHAQPVDPQGALSRLRPGPLPGLSVLDLRPRHVGASMILPAGRVPELLAQEPLAGSYVILEAPPVLESSAAHAGSVAAAVTILAIDPERARVREAREAVDVLHQSGAVVMGAVLAPTGDEQHPQHGLLDDERANRSGPEHPSRDQVSGSGGWSWWSGDQGSAGIASDTRLVEPEIDQGHDVSRNGSSSGMHTR